MAETLKKEFDADAELIQGSGGVFDVHVDGRKVWSKHEMDRFPEHREVVDGIHKLQRK